ncbi:MAG: porin [Alteromonadaceae bacterium]|nr:porin [Alteromonadaceae bacterium]
MKIKSSLLAVSSCLLLNTVSNVAMADVNFNGFASIVGGVTTASGEQLYGYNDNIDFKKGSLFALQASSDLENGLGVTAQIIARGANDWDPKFEWAYLSYDATDNLRFLVGRQRAPFYMYSDFLDVSYAYPWITPPNGVYNLLFDSFDGIGILYSGQLGEFDTTTHFIYGKNDSAVSALGETITPDFKDFTGLSFSANREWLTLRAAYFQANMTMPFQFLQPLQNGWAQTGFTDISNDVVMNGDKGTFIELGMQIDYNDYILNAEYTNLTLDHTPFGDQKSYYVMVGKRIDNFLVHITYGKDDDSKNDFTASAPFGVAPTLDFLKASTQQIIASQKSDEKYLIVGLRWDFHDSAALKFEYTSFSDNLNNTNDANLFRVALVTVF